MLKSKIISNYAAVTLLLVRLTPKTIWVCLTLNDKHLICKRFTLRQAYSNKFDIKMKPTHYDAALAITCLMRAASQQNLYEEPSFESEWNFEDGFACYQVFIRIYKVNSK